MFRRASWCERSRHLAPGRCAAKVKAAPALPWLALAAMRLFIARQCYVYCALCGPRQARDAMAKTMRAGGDGHAR